MLKIKTVLLVFLCATSTSAFAHLTTMQSRVTRAEDCRAGFTRCVRSGAAVGLKCAVRVETNLAKGGLGSVTDSQGRSTMYGTNRPAILSGSFSIGGEVTPLLMGQESDNYTLGGSFSAYMGTEHGSSARVFFARVGGKPQAYAAILYYGGYAYTCGRLRPQR